MTRVTCAAHGCERTVQRGQLMCKGHWFSLPKAMRDDVWRTWRTCQRHWRGRTDHAQQLREVRAYRDAVRHAVDYLDGVPPTPAAAMETVAIGEDGAPVRYGQGRML